ncbi:MAG: S8 family serine peptidase [Saezia sp.]
MTLLSAAALLAMSAPVKAQYVESGQIGNKASWDTTEYQTDWGLAAMKASSAYALGFQGQKVKVGVMDSGAILNVHSDLSGDRFHAVRSYGVYGSSGERYPQNTVAQGKKPYTEGEIFDITGQWVLGLNDGHGTHVTGTVGANRDGAGMHGVAWGADIYAGNNGGTDGNNYGPYQDYNFFYAGWKAMVDEGVQVINNSWGTNVRTTDRLTIGPDFNPSGTQVGTGVHLPADTIADTEYEYYYFRKVYGDKPSFVDAAYDAVKGTGTVQIFTTGNRDFVNPFHRALYPYFHPEAEQYWIAVGGLAREQVASSNPIQFTGKYIFEETFNEAGNAKWWTVVAPGRIVNSTTVNSTTGAPGYGNSSGTSMSAPHVAGAMGVLLSRYQDMSGIQVRDVMFTTAHNKNPDGTVIANWTATPGVPDERFGWGIPDLEKGMYGPGQYLGRFEYNMATTPLDVWSNNISQVALDARRIEDAQWLADYQLWQGDGLQHGDVGGPFELGANFVVNDGNSDTTDHVITQANADQWRSEYYAARAAAIQAKVDGGLYDGSLVKSGTGMLIMTGDNTYRGGTTVQDGAVYGFTESFGTGTVSVNGGQFGVISSYNDAFTQKGSLTSTEVRKANIEVNNGGTYVIVANNNVNVDALTFKDGSSITVGVVGSDGLSVLNDVHRNGTVLTGTVTANSFNDLGKAKVADLAFFNTTLQTTFGPSGTITGTLSKASDTTFATYASNDNESAIARVIDANPSSALYSTLLPATKAQLRATYASLGSDMHMNANNASVTNTLLVSRTARNQAMGLGYGQTTMVAGGDARLWMAGAGSWSNVDYGNSDMDVDFYAGLLGGEYGISENSTIGGFVGIGTTKYKGDSHGKIDSDDIHVGLYGMYKIPNMATLTYGVMHTNQDRDLTRTLVVGSNSGTNSVSNDAKITQNFAEAAYAGWNTEKRSVEPYAGLDLIRVKSDGFSETVSGMQFDTESSKQTMQMATVGIRGSIPFNLGGVTMAAKGNISGMHFFGDTKSEANMYLANTGTAKIEGGKLDNLFGVSFGVEAQLRQSSKIGISFNGVYNGDIKSNGIYVKGVINF